MKKATTLAICSIVTALSVVLMFLGGITFIFAYIMPMLVGMLMIMLKRTFGTASAWITYIATSVLSFILVADKECMLMYVMLFGFYPIIQSGLNKIRIKPLSLILKLLIFNSLLAIIQIILVYVFGIPFLEDGEGKWLLILFAVLMNLLFIIYDRLIITLTRLYEIKLEKKIKKYFK